MPNFRLAAHYINMCTNVPLTLVKSIGKCRKFAQSLWSAKIEYQLDLHRNFDRIFFNFQPVVTGISLSNHLNPKIKTSSMPILNCFPYFHVFLSHSFLLYFCFIVKISFFLNEKRKREKWKKSSRSEILIYRLRKTSITITDSIF